MPASRVSLVSLALFLVTSCQQNTLAPAETSASSTRLAQAASSLAASAADEEIAFYSDRDGDREIYIMKGDGTGLRQLTFNEGEDLDPTWSPDGSKIAFMSDRDGGAWEIYVMNADGSGQTRLTNNLFMDTRPSWSPDGTRIAWSGERFGNWDI